MGTDKKYSNHLVTEYKAESFTIFSKMKVIACILMIFYFSTTYGHRIAFSPPLCDLHAEINEKTVIARPAPEKATAAEIRDLERCRMLFEHCHDLRNPRCCVMAKTWCRNNKSCTSYCGC